VPGGSDGQVGFKTESVVGTAVVVDKFLPFVSEGVKNNITYLDSQTLSARHTVRATKRGTGGIEGPITTELANTTLATLLKHMFGGIATTGAGPYTHTASPADLTGDSMTVQIGRPATSTTVHPFTYAGVKVATWTITANVGEIATLELGLVGMTETTATGLAVASTDATWAPFTFSEAAVTIGGSASNDVRAVTLSGDNKVPLRYRLGSNTSREPLQVGLRDYTGTISTDFASLTDYNRYVNATQAALVVAFNNAPSGGSQTLTFTYNVQFVGETPNVGGFDLLEQPLPFRAISSTSDAAAVTAVLVNSESSAA
jgi:hypothetical protein